MSAKRLVRTSYGSGSPSWNGSFAPSAVFVLAYPSWRPVLTGKSPSINNTASPQDRHAHPNQPIPGLKLLLRLLVVVDQRESGAPPTTKVCPEAKGNDTSLFGFVEGSELLGEFAPWDIRSGGVEDVDDELASCHEAVGDEFARADGYWRVGLAGGESPLVYVGPI